MAANHDGMQWLLERAEGLGVAVQRRSAVSYVPDADSIAAVEQEAEAARAAGLPVQWRDGADVAFPVAAGVELPDQAQVDPLDLLHALAAEVRRLGSEVFEHTRVSGRDGHSVLTSRGAVPARRMVEATGMPFSDSGGFFARLEPQRSYSLALDLPDSIESDMYLSIAGTTRSVRDAVLSSGTAPDPGRADRVLLIGGSGHVVGRARSEREHVEELTLWALTHHPGARVLASWSAQDYFPIDQLPYAGPLHPGGQEVMIATGFGKWGMAAAPAAAMVIASRLLRDGEGPGAPGWAPALQAWTDHEVKGVASAARLEAATAKHLVADRIAAVRSAAQHPDGEAPREGTGRVTGTARPTAVSTNAGVTRAVSATCPHLGGIVAWNDAECTWDCPLHGSRFGADGRLIEGPATGDLRAVEEGPAGHEGQPSPTIR
nr:FAD-dependent oxidoreductase [Serinibacter salmoneus]